MKTISLFERFTKIIGYSNLQEVVAKIKSDQYKKQVTKIRNALHQEQGEFAQQLKKQLPAFTPSGYFVGGRKMKFLERYQSLIVLDIDKISDELVSCKRKASEDAFTRCCFISPGGQGIKILVEADNGMEEHELAFNLIAQYYEQLLGVKIDRSGKDITRLCFFSYDPKIYFQANSEMFQVKNQKEKIEASPAFEECVAFTQQKSTYINGNRNNFLYLLASNCNRAGLPQSDALSQMIAQYDLSPNEIRQSVASAYKNDPTEFQNYSPPLNVPEKESSPPCMPHKIFQRLPALLREGCATFKDHRERDVFLTGALTVLSGCMPKVSGVYDRRVNYSNLFSFIIAPSASGKGALTFAKELGLTYHRDLVKESRETQKTHRQDLHKYELSLSRYKRGKLPSPPEEPEKEPFRLFYIPANSSSAMLIRHLQQNGGRGMLFESEADTLGNVLKQDWGGYSDLLRKAFHHEPIAYSRKNKEEFLEIENPRLSVAISGTPGQVLNLIPSVEDGLFSRFLFYVFEVEAVWRDVSPKNANENIAAFYQSLAGEVKEMVTFLEKYPTTFSLRKDQWEEMNDFFSKRLERTKQLVGPEALSIVKRMGVLFFRLAMILSVCRKYEAQDTRDHLVCSDPDFELTRWLTEVYLEHALYLFHRLPRKSAPAFRKIPANKQAFFEALPNRFKRKEAISIGKRLELSSPTVDRFLKHLLGSLLEQPVYGLYQKCTTDKAKS